jgi:DNA-binding protein HU-beta
MAILLQWAYLCVQSAQQEAVWSVWSLEGLTVNKAQLIEALSERLGDKKAASSAVDGLVDVIVRTVNKGEKVNITGFGVFEKRARAARTARNPRTGETVKVKKTNVPAFRAGTSFKDVISGTKKLPRVAATKAPAAAAATRTTTTRAAAATTTRATATRATAATKAPATRRAAAPKAAPAAKAAAPKKAAAPAKAAPAAKKAAPAAKKAAAPAAKKTTRKK